jgi:hypothetical protein
MLIYVIYARGILSTAISTGKTNPTCRGVASGEDGNKANSNQNKANFI